MLGLKLNHVSKRGHRCRPGRAHEILRYFTCWDLCSTLHHLSWQHMSSRICRHNTARSFYNTVDFLILSINTTYLDHAMHFVGSKSKRTSMYIVASPHAISCYTGGVNMASDRHPRPSSKMSSTNSSVYFSFHFHVIQSLLLLDFYTETEMSFWWIFHHWLHLKVSLRQIPVQSVTKQSSKW